MNGIVLTHGAGSNRNAPLLLAVEAEFVKLGWVVERVNLAFREEGRSGPPRPADAKKDQDGLARWLLEMGERVGVGGSGSGRVFLGGHSYGGRQGSMLLAGRPELASGLLLMGYPLHPPAKPAQMRTAHFGALRVPSLFVSGTKDEFGTEEELRTAVALVPARTKLEMVVGARHDLNGGLGAVAGRIAAGFAEFISGGGVE